MSLDGPEPQGYKKRKRVIREELRASQTLCGITLTLIKPIPNQKQLSNEDRYYFRDWKDAFPLDRWAYEIRFRKPMEPAQYPNSQNRTQEEYELSVTLDTKNQRPITYDYQTDEYIEDLQAPNTKNFSQHILLGRKFENEWEEEQIDLHSVGCSLNANHDQNCFIISGAVYYYISLNVREISSGIVIVFHHPRPFMALCDLEARAENISNEYRFTYISSFIDENQTSQFVNYRRCQNDPVLSKLDSVLTKFYNEKMTVEGIGYPSRWELQQLAEVLGQSYKKMIERWFELQNGHDRPTCLHIIVNLDSSLGMKYYFDYSQVSCYILRNLFLDSYQSKKLYCEHFGTPMTREEIDKLYDYFTSAACDKRELLKKITRLAQSKKLAKQDVELWLHNRAIDEYGMDSYLFEKNFPLVAMSGQKDNDTLRDILLWKKRCIFDRKFTERTKEREKIDLGFPEMSDYETALKKREIFDLISNYPNANENDINTWSARTGIPKDTIHYYIYQSHETYKPYIDKVTEWHEEKLELSENFETLTSYLLSTKEANEKDDVMPTAAIANFFGILTGFKFRISLGIESGRGLLLGKANERQMPVEAVEDSRPSNHTERKRQSSAGADENSKRLKRSPSFEEQIPVPELSSHDSSPERSISVTEQNQSLSESSYFARGNSEIVLNKFYYDKNAETPFVWPTDSEFRQLQLYTGMIMDKIIGWFHLKRFGEGIPSAKNNESSESFGFNAYFNWSCLTIDNILSIALKEGSKMATETEQFEKLIDANGIDIDYLKAIHFKTNAPVKEQFLAEATYLKENDIIVYLQRQCIKSEKDLVKFLADASVNNGVIYAADVLGVPEALIKRCFLDLDYLKRLVRQYYNVTDEENIEQFSNCFNELSMENRVDFLNSEIATVPEYKKIAFQTINQMVSQDLFKCVNQSFDIELSTFVIVEFHRRLLP